MTDTVTEDDVQQTMQGYLSAADRTGQLRGVGVTFTVDGKEWSRSILNLGKGEHPIAAHATVHREGWEPVEVEVLWAESQPAEESWRALWAARPHTLFGAYAIRKALKRAFPGLLGDRREPDDDPTTPPQAAPKKDWARIPEESLITRIGEAVTVEGLYAIRKEAQGTTSITLRVKKALDDRRSEIETEASQPLPPVPQAQPERRGLDPIHPVPKPVARPAAPKPTEPRKDRPRRQKGLTSVEDAMRDVLAKRDKERKS